MRAAMIAALIVLLSGCETNSYDQKCVCETDSKGTETCKCKNYDRSSIYENFSTADTVVYDSGADVIVESMDTKIIFRGF